MKKLYLRMFSVILALSAIMFTFSVSSNLFNAKANTNVGFGIVNGAEVRVPVEGEEDMTGIKFAATLSQSEFTTITNGKTDPVYFGIELTANGVAKDICYLVDSKEKDTLVSKAIDFNGASEYTYTAAITYNEEILATELAEDERFNPNGLTVEEFKKSEDFQKYLISAYSTEITAKAFYRVGNDENAAKSYGSGEVTRSMWGVASYYYGLADEFDILAEKYFTNIEDAVAVEAIIETGAIDYEFAANDKIFFDAQKITVTDGILPASVLEGKQIGDVITISVVSADGALTKLNITLKSQNVVVDAQAYYDAAADKIYFTDGGVQKTIQGSKDASFAYVVDATTSYALADYSGETMVSNVNYKYADSVYFEVNTRGNAYVDYRGGHVRYLQPKLKTESGDVVVQIPYNPQKDIYTGVTIKGSANGLIYNFTNTVIVSQMIDDGKELDNIFNNADKHVEGSANNALATVYVKGYGTITKGVYMLANDIDCSTGFSFDNSAWNYFEGVFDGRGHNIYNLNVSGTEENPGNGLFSATSYYSAIQNVGFINVTANYGSVFQGNMFDYVKSVNTIVDTYYIGNVKGDDGADKLGSVYYRKQLVDDSDTTTTIGELLKSGSRQGIISGGYGQGGYFQNVFVQVNSATQRLMGVICRNMLNRPNTVRANNMVIEYLPTQLYDSAEGANDGALPYGYNYTEGKYGVLFGGAYENKSMSYRAQYETNASYETNETVLSNFTNITYFTPKGNASYANRPMQSGASLTFYRPAVISYGTWYMYRMYIISTVGLVSCVQGSILGTNETADANNPYKFEAMTLWSHYDKPLADSGYENEYSKLERYDSYDLLKAAYSAGATNQQITSYMFDGGAEENYWDISEGYLKWRNVKAN